MGQRVGRHEGGIGALQLVELLTIGDQTDETGRLLLEDSAGAAARKEAVRQGIPMLSRSCPYRDTPSRFGGRMNISAFEALRPHTTGMLDGFAWLTSERLSTDRSLAGTTQLLYETSYLGLTLPLVLLHRASSPFRGDGELPEVVASIFKASRGLFMVAVDLRNQPRPPSERIDGAAVVAFADRHHHLVRRQPARVCAAPTRLIERTVSVILSGDGAAPAVSRLPEWVDFPTLWQCYQIQDQLSEALSTYRYILNQLSPPSHPVTTSRLFGQMVPGTSGTFGQLTEAVVAHANSAQIALNRALGRQGRPKPLAADDVLGLL